ncbi:hypothetical protein E2C01_021363 [Portunus trituberculatus]|uniref:Uncharacterized protein n=1 Tax=Portunus trituberculatus TaxID=210409 RepID=A0A5B7E332_PORTR|nr:hypothetical protein [Portunus trituberculatus]
MRGREVTRETKKTKARHNIVLRASPRPGCEDLSMWRPCGVPRSDLTAVLVASSSRCRLLPVIGWCAVRFTAHRMTGERSSSSIQGTHHLPNIHGLLKKAG